MSAADPPQTVAVLGAGRMGALIAADFALVGHTVRFTVSSRTDPGAGLARIHRAVDGPIEGQLTCVASSAEAAAGAVLVVEALPEDLALKQAELAAAQRAAPEAALATSTSSLSVTEMAAALDDPTKLVGAHYINPPWAFREVEIVAGDRSAPDVLGYVEALLRSMDREPVRVSRDVPGFVLNRLQFALLREAVALVEQGVTTPEQLDQLMSNVLARRWTLTGPFNTAAVGGPELFARIAEQLFPTLSNASTPPAGAFRALAPSTEQIDEARRTRDQRLAAHPGIPRHWRGRIS